MASVITSEASLLGWTQALFWHFLFHALYEPSTIDLILRLKACLQKCQLSGNQYVIYGTPCTNVNIKSCSGLFVRSVLLKRISSTADHEVTWKYLINQIFLEDPNTFGSWFSANNAACPMEQRPTTNFSEKIHFLWLPCLSNAKLAISYKISYIVPNI
jgi:hypothetical protein